MDMVSDAEMHPVGLVSEIRDCASSSHKSHPWCTRLRDVIVHPWHQVSVHRPKLVNDDVPPQSFTQNTHTVNVFAGLKSVVI